MALSKITSADLAGKGVIGLPDTPNLTTSAMQQKFEQTAREVIVPKFNDLIDELNNSGSEDIGYDNTVSGLDATNVQDAIDEVLSDSLDAAGAVQSNLDTHTADTNNPHSVTKAQVGLGNADNTSDINKPISTATQNALDLKADLAQLNLHVANVSNPHSVTKAQVGLGNADNTSDMDKPISTATQNALDLKANASSLGAHTGNKNNPHEVTKAQVGLGNVDNTADLVKPISVLTQEALDEKLFKDNVADEYDSSKIYSKGDLVTYVSHLYQANKDTSGAFNSADWNLTTVEEQLDMVNQRIEDNEIVESFSGNPVSFKTPYAQLLDELTVSVSPKQSTTPWIGSTQDTDPYTFRAMPSGASGGNREYDKLVGGSVVWNQGIGAFKSSIVTDLATRGLTATRTENATKLVVTGTANGSFSIAGFFNGVAIVKDHIYLLDNRATGNCPGLGFTSYGFSADKVKQIVKATNSGSATGAMNIVSGEDYDFTIQTVFYDLTAMFGTTVAESILAMGDDDGSAFFYKYFGNKHHAYSAPTIQSVSVSEKVTTGKNLFDEDTAYSSFKTGTNAFTGTAGGVFVIKNYIPSGLVGKQITASVKYTAIASTSAYIQANVNGTNKNGNSRSSGNLGVSSVTFTPTSTSDFFCLTFGSGSSQNISFCDIQLEIGSTATAYEAYDANTYALSTTELRGIPSLVDGKLVYDGDEYASSGAVTRKYDIATVQSRNPSMLSSGIFYGNLPRKYGQGIFDVLAEGYVTYTGGHSTSSNIQSLVQANGDGVYLNAGSNTFFIADSAYTSLADFLTAKGSKVMLYELATPTTESTTPFDNPQVIDPNGTESYTDYPVSQGTRDVAIPVGHKSNYALSVPVIGMDEVSVNVSGVNAYDGLNAQGAITSSGGLNSNLTSRRGTTRIPVVGGESYTLSVNAQVYGLYICYYDKDNVSLGRNDQLNSSSITALAPQNATNARFSINYDNSTTFTEDMLVALQPQFELGSTPTAYVPYDSNSATYTHSMSTMYGGQVEFVSGVETSEMAEVDLSTLTWTLVDANRFRATVSGIKQVSSSAVLPNMKCTAYTPVPSADRTDFTIFQPTGSNKVDIIDPMFDNATDFSAALNGIVLVYELATPTTNQGAVSAVELLKGENVLSTDGDSLSLSCVESTQGYIDARIPAPPSSDGTYSLQVTVSGGVATYSWS